jgi:hypothetical protein
MSYASAQATSVAGERELGKLWGIGEGFAMGIAHASQPQYIERSQGDKNVELRTYTGDDWKVTVVHRSGGGDLPGIVAAKSSTAVRSISTSLAETPRSAMPSMYGAPISESRSHLRFQGLAEICEDYVEFGFDAENLTSVEWVFCVD